MKPVKPELLKAIAVTAELLGYLHSQAAHGVFAGAREVHVMPLVHVHLAQCALPNQHQVRRQTA